MNLKKILFALYAALSVSNSFAFSQKLDSSVAALTACDASFFQTLHQEKEAWKKHANIETVNAISWIKTTNRKQDNGNVYKFKAPIKAQGLTLTHFIDESSSIGENADFYYWGFKVTGTVDETAEQLKKFMVASERLRKVDDSYVRTELKIGKMPWLQAKLESGKIPRALTVERVLLIEADESQPNTSKVLCSIQGSITADVLQEIRPDIARAEYPTNIDPDMFEKTPIDAQALSYAKNFLDSHPMFKAKFKKVSYTVKNDGLSHAVQLTAEDTGLIFLTEHYGVFDVKRLTIAGEIQLKGGIVGRGSPVYGKQYNIQVQQKFDELGSLFSYEHLSQAESTSEIKVTCKIDEQFEATKIFKSLTGSAVQLICSRQGSKDKEYKAYIEDLGIFVNYKPASMFGGKAKPEYTEFEVER